MKPLGIVALLCLAAAPALAQNAAPANPPGMNESRLHSEFRREGDALAPCKQFTFGGISGCGQTLIMGQPMHIAVGSMPPQNGFAAGLAFVDHKHFTDEWNLNWDIDAEAAPSGSWRAGGYLKAYRLGGSTPVMSFGTTTKHTSPFFNAAPLIYAYSQTTSLTRVDFFGLGPNTTPLTHTTYGFTENVTGASAIVPIAGPFAKMKLALVAELNGRFPSVRPGTDATLPSIGALFNEASAPGLTRQAAYFEPSEGLRIDPALFKDHIRLNYLLQFQQFIAPGNATYSFRRWNADFNHELPLYKILPSKLAALYTPNRAASAYLQHDGPDDCTGAGSNISLTHIGTPQVPARPCPPIATTAKLEGSIALRAFISESFAGRGSFVPFYLSPTIGGSDIDGNRMLASYPDYRFRGPNLILFNGTFEHSLGKLPIGAIFSVDEAKIALRRDDIGPDHLRHTFSIGLTIHAGGLPVANLLFSWGGQEGTHTALNLSPTLLGGTARPSLF